MPTKPHRARDYLKTPDDIAAYLNAAMQELDDPRMLMKALRNVTDAQSRISQLARRTEPTSSRSKGGV